MAHQGWTDKRPLSPHLWHWRWHVTMLGSILHRATGVANYLGAILVVGWLFAAASGPEAYGQFAAIAGSPPGLVVLFGFTLGVCYHLLNGLRHLVLDAGAGLQPRAASTSAIQVLAGAIAAAVVIWAVILIPGVLPPAGGQ